MRDRAYFEDTCRRIVATRERSAQALKELGFFVLPSKTNFLFAANPEQDAGTLFAALRERKILVRYFNTPGIDRFLRITVGTDAEMDALLSALGDSLKAI